MDLSIFQQIGIAALLGSLIGLERQRKEQEPGSKEIDLERFGGIRTFTLIAILGAVAVMFFHKMNSLFIVLSLGFIALLTASYVISAKNLKDVGITSEMAAILVYVVGILSGMERYSLAVALALIILAILHFKAPLHKWAKSVQNEEIVAGIQFMIVAFVVLPILPNQGFGPYEFFNPYIIWLMVVLISGISFLSYIAIKIFGRRNGVCVTGFFAGFISSTALAFGFSERSKKNKKIVTPYVLAILIASTAMFVRVLIEVKILNAELLELLLVPMLAMTATGAIFSVWLYLKGDKTPKAVLDDVKSVDSPFALKPALQFGLVFAGILFLSEVANDFFGSQGIYLTSVASGIIDVDAITVSMANLAKQGTVAKPIAAMAIIIATITNTLSKAGICLIFGGRKVAMKVLVLFLLISAVGAATVFVV